jgi:hypothetical protein
LELLSYSAAQYCTCVLFPMRVSASWVITVICQIIFFPRQSVHQKEIFLTKEKLTLIQCGAFSNVYGPGVFQIVELIITSTVRPSNLTFITTVTRAYLWTLTWDGYSPHL